MTSPWTGNDVMRNSFLFSFLFFFMDLFSTLQPITIHIFVVVAWLFTACAHTNNFSSLNILLENVKYPADIGVAHEHANEIENPGKSFCALSHTAHTDTHTETKTSSAWFYCMTLDCICNRQANFCVIGQSCLRLHQLNAVELNFNPKVVCVKCVGADMNVLQDKVYVHFCRHCHTAI